jgi:hypothetical protein
MNFQPKYILEPYKGMSTRHRCPACRHRNKTFSRYIDVDNNQYLHETVGRCERVDKCGWHLTPKQYFADNGEQQSLSKYIKVTLPPPQPPSFIDRQIFKASLSGYDINNLIKFLLDRFGQAAAQELITKYFIGTSNYWPGSTVFWQIDKSGNVRSGKVMLYRAENGKRVKTPYNHITWAHTVLKLRGYNLKQCLFGEHLLANSTKPAAIVESEKTALIASLYLPKYIWLACGSLQNLTADRCSVLKNRPTILYPDLNAFEKWSIKGKDLGFQTSETLEQVATETERTQGLDLADFLLNTNPTIHNSKHLNYDHNL